MRACLSFPSAARGCGAAGFFFLVLVLLPGCDTETYPGDLAYPLRTDPVIGADKPTQEPAGFDRPGQLDRILLTMWTQAERDKTTSPAKVLNGTQRTELEAALKEHFGTPADPRVKGISEAARAALGPLDNEVLQRGSRLYRQHCLHCHGLTGDGRGPTAAWINPHPRDYRQGVFKFTSSDQPAGSRRARRYDILRVLREGIEGTSMPSFRLLPDGEQEAITSYVIHLSLRGEVEAYVLGDQDARADIANTVPSAISSFGDFWKQTQEKVIQPESKRVELTKESVQRFKESVQRGFKLFAQKGPEGGDAKSATVTAGCLSCHEDFGRRPTYKWDSWGTIVRPADLTTNVYRGGRRPIDLYWRIHSGVNGSGMMASNTVLKSDDIWDLVNFLQVLPYPKMRADYGVSLD